MKYGRCRPPGTLTLNAGNDGREESHTPVKPVPPRNQIAKRPYSWLIVILEAHAQINLKKIRGLWGHGERMTKYIQRRGLLSTMLVEETWVKWSAAERPSELRDNPEAVADVVLFNEVRRLSASCAAPESSAANAAHAARAA